MADFTHIFNKVEIDYEVAQTRTTGPNVLCLVDGYLMFLEVPFENQNPGHLLLFSRFDMRKGISANKWRTVITVIKDLIAEGKLK